MSSAQKLGGLQELGKYFVLILLRLPSVLSKLQHPPEFAQRR